jgi:hypothetical protein
MLNGWYKIIKPTPVNQVLVEFCYNNVFQSGTVMALQERGCIIESIHLLTNSELKSLQDESWQKGYQTALKEVG